MRRSPISWLILLVLAAAPFNICNAQDAPPVRVGDRVRVTAPRYDMNRRDGIVQEMRDSVLTLDTLQLSIGSITRLDVHRGSRGNAGLGALIGLPAGALIGAAIAAAVDQTADQEGLIIAFGAGVGAAGGLLIGIVVGSLIKSDRWEPVPLDQLRVSFVPRRDGRFAFGLSVAF